MSKKFDSDQSSPVAGKNSLQRSFEGSREQLDNYFRLSFSHFIKALGIYVRVLMVNILILVASFFIFSQLSQGQDILGGLVSDENRARLFFFGFGIVLLGLAQWYSTQINLVYQNLSGVINQAFGDERAEISKKRNRRIVTFLPFVFGFLTFFVVALGFWSRNVDAFFYGLGFLILGVVLMAALYVYVRSVRKEKGEEDLIELGEKDPREAISDLDEWIMRLSFWIILIFWLFSLIISFWEPKPVRFLFQFKGIFQTFALMNFFLAGFLMFFSVIWGRYVKTYLQVSLLFILGITIPLFTLFNNNHTIRDVNIQRIDKEGIEENLENWLADRLDSSYTPENRMPVYLLAAEGGGIRSLKWTAMVLNKLIEEDSLFLSHTYAMSGASGGSAGLIFQQAAMSCKLSTGDRAQKLDKASGEDFLAPLTFGLLFPDLTQTIFPFPIQRWDRSQWLEDSWAYTFKRDFDEDVLNKGLTDYFSSNTLRLPNIFLNVACVETGQKGVLSNLSLSDEFFPGVIDIERDLYRNKGEKVGLSLKTAASLSSRFPIVTSAGRMKLVEKTGEGIEKKIVRDMADGGYHDNTGLETVFQILNLLVQKHPDKLSRLDISIVFFKNSETIDLSKVKVKNFLADLTVPLNTILSNWNNGTYNTRENANVLVNTLRSEELSLKYYEMELNREVYCGDKECSDSEKTLNESLGRRKIILPLGWYLSETAKDEFRRQVACLKDSSLHLDGDEIAQRNSRNFYELLDKLKAIPQAD